MRREVTEIIGDTNDRFLAVAGDISQPETGRDFVSKTVERFGELNIFVSNAGVCQFAEFLEYLLPLHLLPAHNYTWVYEMETEQTDEMKGRTSSPGPHNQHKPHRGILRNPSRSPTNGL